MATDKAVTTRPRTFWEKQPYIVGYGAIISLVSPAATAYQLCKLYKLPIGATQLFGMSMAIFPHQTFLKTVQMDLSTPVKETFNPWLAFGVVGVLQGGVYGQCNVYFSNALKLGAVASYSGMFRGSLFAGVRDTLSQGIPFMCSGAVKTNVMDRMIPTPKENASPLVEAAKLWSSVLSTSVFATVASQGLHNCQICMQADSSLGYASAVQQVWRQHSYHFLYRGAEARIGLLLLVNVLNELLLKPAWAPVEMEAAEVARVEAR